MRCLRELRGGSVGARIQRDARAGNTHRGGAPRSTPRGRAKSPSRQSSGSFSAERSYPRSECRQTRVRGCSRRTELSVFFSRERKHLVRRTRLKELPTHVLVRDRERRDVEQRMEGKDDEEEGAEVVKHFDEEVPREADVGFQVRDGEAVGRQRASTRKITAASSVNPQVIKMLDRGPPADLHDSVHAREEGPTARPPPTPPQQTQLMHAESGRSLNCGAR